MAWADHSNEIEPSSTDNLFLETDLYGQQNDKLHRRRWRLGLLILLLVLLLWLTSTFLLNFLFEGGIYRKPCLVTYLTSCSFVVLLIPTGLNKIENAFLKYKVQNKMPTQSENPQNFTSRKTKYKHTHKNENTPLIKKTNKRSSSETSLDIEVGEQRIITLQDTHTKSMKILSTSQLCIIAIQYSFIYYFANLTINASLGYLSAGTETALFSTTSLFSLVFGVIMNVEHFTTTKLLATLMSLAGITFVTIASNSTDENSIPNDGGETPNYILGVFLSMIGTALFAAYTVFLKVKLDHVKLDTSYFFGLAGFFSIVLLWPVIIACHYFEIEELELPSSIKVYTIIMINVIVAALGDYLWCFAVLMTSPLVVTIGQAANIPLAMLGDMVIRGEVGSLGYYLGVLFIATSFVLVDKQEENESDSDSDSDCDLVSDLNLVMDSDE